MGSRMRSEEERAHAMVMAQGREILGGQEFARVTGEGAALGYEETLAEAQAWLEDPPPSSHSEASLPGILRGVTKYVKN
jgi:hypothetical protein